VVWWELQNVRGARGGKAARGGRGHIGARHRGLQRVEIGSGTQPCVSHRFGGLVRTPRKAVRPPTLSSTPPPPRHASPHPKTISVSRTPLDELGLGQLQGKHICKQGALPGIAGAKQGRGPAGCDSMHPWKRHPACQEQHPRHTTPTLHLRIVRACNVQGGTTLEGCPWMRWWASCWRTRGTM
jgi:hypothetical protein